MVSRFVTVLTGLLVTAGCFGYTEWERFSWREPRNVDDRFPATGVHNGYEVTERRFEVVAPPTDSDLRNAIVMQVNHSTVDAWWSTGEYGLLRLSRGNFHLDYSSTGYVRDGTVMVPGHPRFEAPQLQVWCFLGAPTTLRNIRFEFVRFVTNATMASQPEAEAWALEAFPESEQARLDWQPPPGTTYEYYHAIPVNVSLRLDDLLREQGGFSEPKGDLGGATLWTGTWEWEFFLVTKEASKNNLLLAIDAAGNAYFDRRGQTGVGETELERRLQEAFRDLGLGAPAATYRRYEHSRHENG